MDLDGVLEEIATRRTNKIYRQDIHVQVHEGGKIDKSRECIYIMPKGGHLFVLLVTPQVQSIADGINLCCQYNILCQIKAETGLDRLLSSRFEQHIKTDHTSISTVLITLEAIRQSKYPWPLSRVIMCPRYLTDQVVRKFQGCVVQRNQMNFDRYQRRCDICRRHFKKLNGFKVHQISCYKKNYLVCGYFTDKNKYSTKQIKTEPE